MFNWKLINTTMSKKEMNLESSQKEKDNNKKENVPGYPLYPDNEDIYNKFKKERNINPEEVSKRKEPISTNDFRKEALDKKESELSGDDLDVPGSELDDAQEAIGNEDEENNYYSLGGDDHNDLEEDR